MVYLQQDESPDPLAGRVIVEDSPVFDMVLIVNKLSMPSTHHDGLPRDLLMLLRKRLQPKTLTTFESYAYIIPVGIVLKVPAPRTAEGFFEYLESIPANSFVDTMFASQVFEPAEQVIVDKIMNSEPLTELEHAFFEKYIESKKQADHIIRMAPGLKNQASIKALLLEALRDFYQGFFQREIERITPILETSASQTRSLINSGLVPVRKLIEGLTRGFTLSGELSHQRIILAPSYFNSPYVTAGAVSDTEYFLVYPTRTEEIRHNGQDINRERLLQQLKALADKTRLDILRLLAQRAYYTQELADTLNLSQPTISHHMRDLRVAGLVRVEQFDNTKLYTLNASFLQILIKGLQEDLGLESAKHST